MNHSKNIFDKIIMSLFTLFFLSVPISIAAENTFGALVLLTWIIKSIFIEKPDLRGIRDLGVFLVLYFIAAIISTFLGADMKTSLHTFHSHLRFLLIFPLMSEIKNKKNLHYYLILIIVSLTGNSIYAIWQHFHGVQRVGGTYHFYMTYAGMAMLLSFLALYFIFYFKNLFLRLVFAAAYLAVFFSIVFTETRNAWLGIIVGLTLFFAVKLKKYALIPIGLIVVVYFFLPAPVHKRFESIYKYKTDGSAEVRIKMWKTAPSIWKDYWYRGIWINNLSEVFPKYNKYKYINTFNHLHNNYFQVLTEFGIIGFIAFLFLLIKSFAVALKMYGRTRDTLFITFASSIAAFSVAGFFEYSFGDTEVVISYIVIVTLIYALRKIYQGTKIG